jgi:hypothetical protein
MDNGKIPEGAISRQTLEKLAITKVANITGVDPEDLSISNVSFGYNDHFAKDIYECEISGVGRKSCNVELDVQTGDLLFYNNPAEFSPSKNRELEKDTEKKLREKIKSWFTPPEDAEFDGTFANPQVRSDKNMFELRWNHKGWMGDYISISINPVSMNVWNFAKKWEIE